MRWCEPMAAARCAPTLPTCLICGAAQHMAYEDLCFLAERDAARRHAVFADRTGASWSELVKAALKPIGAKTHSRDASAAASRQAHAQPKPWRFLKAPVSQGHGTLQLCSSGEPYTVRVLSHCTHRSAEGTSNSCVGACARLALSAAHRGSRTATAGRRCGSPWWATW